MFADRFGITDIIDTQERLSINWDYDDDVADLKQHQAVLLYVPNKDHHEHFHIELSDRQCEILRDWLDAYLTHKKG